MRKRARFAAGAIAATSLLLSGCAAGGDAGGDSDFKVGIVQLVQHPALDAATEGFQEAFEKAGVNAEFDVQVANGEAATATTIASSFASDPNIDLVLAVATPAAQSAATAITQVPVLFTAVTDPVEAGLVESLDSPGSNVTGTTDLNPVADQVALIKEIQPEAASVGVIYSSGEVNSRIQVDIAKEEAKKSGLKLKEATVANVGEVPTALESLGDVDALYIPTDNTVISGLSSVLTYAEGRKIPVVTGDTDSVEAGATATLGLNYRTLGEQTGEMAIRLLTEDGDPATMAVESQKEFDLVLNKQSASTIGLEFSKELLDRAVTVIDK